jgi:hypothetical protein
MLMFLTTLFFGPRAALVIWWLINPNRFSDAFSEWIIPVLGILFLPWTTLTYVIVYSSFNGVNGFEWLFLALGFFADISSYIGSARRRRAVY